MERKAVVKYKVDQEAGTIMFQVLGAGSCTLDLEKTSEATRQAALYNGFKQAGGDKCAIPRDLKTGLSATPAMKFARLKEWVESLNGGGEWTLRQAGLSLNRAALFQAVAEVRGVPAEKVAARFAGTEDSVLQTFLTHRDIAGVYARITAPESSEAADELLAGL